jgi:hypothetical protein
MSRIFAIILAILLIASGALAGCASQYLPRVSAQATGPAAQPLLPLNGGGLDGWRDEEGPAALALLQSEVYGALPPVQPGRIQERVTLTTNGLPDGAGVERWRVALAGEMGLDVALVLPAGDGPHPVVLMQTFCPLGVVTMEIADWGEMGESPCGDGEGLEAWAIKRIFGEHIMAPPWSAVLERGYALAIIYPGEMAPDSASRAPAALAAIEAELGFDTDWGVIAAWAWMYSGVERALGADPRLDADRVALWGHSRNGKSALLSAAFDPEIDLVLSLQSGTGGATLNRSHNGESIGEITEGYPHWFNATYADWNGREEEMPVEQHQLLALIAPRPVLLANARRDQWSDPHGSWRAAEGADRIWELYGVRGLDQDSLVSGDLSAELSFYTRDGLHGVHRLDWDRALDFMDAHWGVPQAASGLTSD